MTEAEKGQRLYMAREYLPTLAVCLERHADGLTGMAKAKRAEATYLRQQADELEREVREAGASDA